MLSQRHGYHRFILILLTIELIDELVGGVREAAWPLLRADLSLTYAQIGILMAAPGIVGNLIEPFIGILGDTWNRRALILGGGVVFVVSCGLAAASASFLPLLIAYILFFPASGAYVSLSQAVLMDLDPQHNEHNMARWTFAGSLGVVGGPLLVSAAVAAGLGWREPFWLVAGLALIMLAVSWSAYQGSHFEPARQPEPLLKGLLVGLRQAGQALRRGEVLRWLGLLEASDLMLDVLYGYIALYLVDTVGVDSLGASLGVAVWTGVGLLGDFLLIPLLRHVPGLVYLRISAALELALFPAFLLAPGLGPKLALLGLLGFFNSGWYSILKARLYSAMPGQSGAVTTVGNVFGLFGKLLPLGIGLAADRFGLGIAMWILILGPLALLAGLPRTREGSHSNSV